MGSKRYVHLELPDSVSVPSPDEGNNYPGFPDPAFQTLACGPLMVFTPHIPASTLALDIILQKSSTLIHNGIEKTLTTASDSCDSDVTSYR